MKKQSFKYIIYHEGKTIGCWDIEQALQYCETNKINRKSIIPVVGEVR